MCCWVPLQMAKHLVKLLDASSAHGCRDGQDQPPSSFVLLLASLCLQLRDRTVPHMTGLLESAFMSQPSSASGMWFDAALLTRCGCTHHWHACSRLQVAPILTKMCHPHAQGCGVHVSSLLQHSAGSLDVCTRSAVFPPQDA